VQNKKANKNQKNNTLNTQAPKNTGRIRRLKRTVPFTFRRLEGGLEGGASRGLQALLKGA